MATYAPSAASVTAARAGTLTVQVTARAEAARDAITLWLALPGTQRAPSAYRPGQFITLALPTARGTQYRSYSLCGDGRPDRPWEITVKRRNGGPVSSYLCDTAGPGMLLTASLPAGAFTLPTPLDPKVPLIFVATGSGITPVIGMLRALARLAPERRPKVLLHYAYHSPADAIYGRELAALDAPKQWLRQWHYVSTHGYRLLGGHALAAAGSAAAAAHWYICGTAALKGSLEALLVRRGVPPAQVHVEMFASPRPPAMDAGAMSAGTPAGAGARVRLADAGVVLNARPRETLLETLERHGYQTPFSCRAGACGTCRLKLLSGQVSGAGGGGLSAAERAAGYVQSCVARPAGEVVLASAGAPAARRSRAAISAAGRPGRAAIRWGLLAASLTLFVGAWRLTTQASLAGASAAPAQQSSPASGDGSGNSNDTSGSGGITIGPSQTAPNTSSGTS